MAKSDVNIPAITIRNLRKSFKGRGDSKLIVYDGFNLTIESGKVTAILGPNGCGKSTLIDMILGLEPKDAGSILILGQDSDKNRDKMGVVFQGLGLFPWLSVKENLLFGVRNKPECQSKDSRELLATSFLHQFGLDKFSEMSINSLSGGMQQKLALARVLITDPDIFIFDEPFSSLDHSSKYKIIAEIKKININFKKTIVFVTHNIQDALDLGQNIIVLGKKSQHPYFFENKNELRRHNSDEIKRVLSIK